MNYFLNSKRFNSLIVGTLAAVMLSLTFTGCAEKAMIVVPPSSQIESSSTQSSASSQTNSSAAASSRAASSAAAKSQVSSAVKASSVTAVKPSRKTQVKKPAAAKAETGNKAIKKIAVDKSTENATRLNVTKSTAAAKQGYTGINQRAGYNCLTDEVSRSLYNQLCQSAYKVSVTPTSQGYYPIQRIIVSGSHLTEAELRVTFLAFINDNPQIFWLANAYSYGYSDNETQIQLYSVAPQNECNTMIQKLNQKVSAIEQAMPSGLNEFDRELYLVNYLADHCVYDNDAVTDGSMWKPFASYGALVEGKAVCEGYSRAMQYLSSCSGLQSILVRGRSDGVNHMWNMMKIDGNWYHLDTTWCDSDFMVYNFFNLNDQVIAQTHSIFPNVSTLTDSQIDGTGGSVVEFNLAIPCCTSTDKNYFETKGIKISNLDGTNDSEIITALSVAAKSKNNSISFYVEESADYDQIVSGMIESSPYKIVSYISEVNSKLGMTNQIDISKIKYVGDKANRGVTIYLSYK